MTQHEFEREKSPQPAHHAHFVDRPGGGNPNVTVSVSYTSRNGLYSAQITITPNSGKAISSVKAANFNGLSNGRDSVSSATTLTAAAGTYPFSQGASTNTYFGLYVNTTDGESGGDVYQWNETSPQSGWSLTGSPTQPGFLQEKAD